MLIYLNNLKIDFPSVQCTHCIGGAELRDQLGRVRVRTDQDHPSSGKAIVLTMGNAKTIQHIDIDFYNLKKKDFLIKKNMNLLLK